MTDLRARIVDALAEAHFTGCSYAQTVDLLLSLPDLVIVDAERHRRQLFDLLKGIIDGEWGPYEDDHYWLMVDEFLAAAHAVETTSEVS